MTTYICENGIILNSLSIETLEEILEKLGKIQKELCAVRIGEQWGEYYLYGVFEMTVEEYDNYKDSGGTWNYHPASHYENMVRSRIRQLH